MQSLGGELCVRSCRDDKYNACKRNSTKRVWIDMHTWTANTFSCIWIRVIRVHRHRLISMSTFVFWLQSSSRQSIVLIHSTVILLDVSLSSSSSTSNFFFVLLFTSSSFHPGLLLPVTLARIMGQQAYLFSSIPSTFQCTFTFPTP